MAHYEDIVPEIPPANRPVVCGTWWGCGDWMVKSGTPHFAEGEAVQTLALRPRFLALAEDEGRSAKDAHLGPARWGRHGDGYLFAYIPIGAAEGYAVNPIYLNYASAIAEVEEWRWLPADGVLRHEGRPHKGGGLVGLRGGEVVAVVCPVINKPGAA